MSEKALDLRRSMQIVRRHKFLVGFVVVLGIAAGAAYAVLKPPMLTSTALIALQEPASVQQSTTTGGVDTFTATQEIVAVSYPVLSDALPDVRPAMSLDELRHNVQVGSLSSEIISVNAKGKNAADAEATADAVANSYVRYVSSPHSAVGMYRRSFLSRLVSQRARSR